MAVLLWCVKCTQEAVIAGEVPVVCPHCREVTEWTSIQPYTVNENDRRFLRSIHVQTEREPS